MLSEEIKRIKENLDTLPAGLMDQLKFVRHVCKWDDKEEVDDYLILEEYPEIDYVLLRREAKYEPFVAAWAYNKEGNYWGQGHYFSELIDAVNYIQSKIDEKNKVEKFEITKDFKEEVYDTLTDEIEYYIFESHCVEEHESTIFAHIGMLKALGYKDIAEEYENDYESEVNEEDGED